MPTGYALCVGVDRVDPHAYDRAWDGALERAESDAARVADLLARLGFRPAPTPPGVGRAGVLLGREATRRGMLDSLGRAAALAGEGDLFCLFFAGHGGRVPDTNGDEDDGFDETLCLFDGELVDDELAAAWAAFPPGSRVLMLADSCHSGTVSSLWWEAVADAGVGHLLLERHPLGDARDVPRPRAMPADVAEASYAARRAEYDAIQAATGGGDGQRRLLPIRIPVLLLAACHDNQLAQEGRSAGVFTRALLAVYEQGAFGGDYDQLLKELVRRSPPTQTPRLTVVPDAASTAAHRFRRQRAFTI